MRLARRFGRDSGLLGERLRPNCKDRVLVENNRPSRASKHRVTPNGPSDRAEREIIMSIRKPYFPSRTFDDQLTALVALFVAKGWSFPGVDTAQLTQDAVDQRSERAAHDAIEAQYASQHQAFGVAQQKRHER